MITIKADNPPTLKEAQTLVGGYVEMVYLRDGRQMLCDEDGLAKELAVNVEASLIAGRMIVGPVLILEDKARWTD